MSESAGMRIKRCVDHPKDRSKLTCLIHGPVHSSDECKVPETLVLSMINLGVINTSFRSLQLRRNLEDRKIKILYFNMQLMRSSYSVQDETHKNIDSEVYED